MAKKKNKEEPLKVYGSFEQVLSVAMRGKDKPKRRIGWAAKYRIKGHGVSFAIKEASDSTFIVDMIGGSMGITTHKNYQAAMRAVNRWAKNNLSGFTSNAIEKLD